MSALGTITKSYSSLLGEMIILETDKQKRWPSTWKFNRLSKQTFFSFTIWLNKILLANNTKQVTIIYRTSKIPRLKLVNQINLSIPVDVG